MIEYVFISRHILVKITQRFVLAKRTLVCFNFHLTHSAQYIIHIHTTLNAYALAMALALAPGDFRACSISSASVLRPILRLPNGFRNITSLTKL